MKNNNTTAQPLLYTVVRQYIKDISFENFRTPNHMLLAQGDTANTEVQFSVQAQPITQDKIKNVFTVTLNFTLESKCSKSKKTLYIVEIVYGALVSVPVSTAKQTEGILMVEVPRLLFPFVRSLTNGIVQEAGFAPFLLKPIDFLELWRQQKKQSRKPPLSEKSN